LPANDQKKEEIERPAIVPGVFFSEVGNKGTLYETTLGAVARRELGFHRPRGCPPGATSRRFGPVWSVFHTKMALDTKLKQLALFMISW